MNAESDVREFLTRVSSIIALLGDDFNRHRSAYVSSLQTVSSVMCYFATCQFCFGLSLCVIIITEFQNLRCGTISIRFISVLFKYDRMRGMNI